MYSADRLISFADQLGVYVIVAIAFWFILHAVVYKYIAGVDNNKAMRFGGWFIVINALIGMAYAALSSTINVFPIGVAGVIIIDWLLAGVSYFIVTMIDKSLETNKKWYVITGTLVAAAISYALTQGLASLV